jgi:ATP-dependent protease ClpP protease subunit
VTQQTYPILCRITNEDGAPTRVDVFDDIGEGGWFGGLSAKSFASQVKGIKGALEVHINSGGGDVFDGIAIGNAIRSHKGPVKTVVDGLAASIASVIAQAGQERIVQPGAMLMIHDAFGGCLGNAAEMKKMADTLDQVSDNLAEIYASRAGGDAATWRDTMRGEKWYTAEQAVADGLADKIGDGEAELPAGLDIAAFEHIPGRIAARLRTMPQAKVPVIVDADGNHAPMTGSHSHSHPAYGSQGGDANHAHDHSHDGDASHNHSHAAPDGSGGDGAQDRGQGLHGDAQGPCCSMCGPDCTCGGVPGSCAAAAAMQTHNGHARVDPDGDGDCDACPEGDTDHDYFGADGSQVKALPGQAGNTAPYELTAELKSSDLGPLIRATMAALLADSGGVDNSAWDASKAWHAGATSDDPAAFYAGICAGQKAGDRTTQDAWALPYKYAPSSPPNAAGVKNALSRLPQTEGLTNEAEAKALLQRLMKRINPDYDPDASANTDLDGIDLDEIRSALKGANA